MRGRVFLFTIASLVLAAMLLPSGRAAAQAATQWAVALQQTDAQIQQWQAYVTPANLWAKVMYDPTTNACYNQNPVCKQAWDNWVAQEYAMGQQALVRLQSNRQYIVYQMQLQQQSPYGGYSASAVSGASTGVPAGPATVPAPVAPPPRTTGAGPAPATPPSTAGNSTGVSGPGVRDAASGVCLLGACPPR